MNTSLRELAVTAVMRVIITRSVNSFSKMAVYILNNRTIVMIWNNVAVNGRKDLTKQQSSRLEAEANEEVP